jgi:tight adherence protein C
MSNIVGLAESGQFVLNVGYAMVGLAAFLVARMLLQEEESRAAQENLANLRDRKASSFLVRVARPFLSQYLVPKIRGKPFWEERRKYYRRKIITSGLREELTPDEFIAFKMFLIIFFPVVGMFLKWGEFLDISWLYIALSTVGGWFYPDLWVRMRIQDRQKKIIRAMPFIVDLLALSTEAGLDFIGAIGKVVDKAAPSPLIEEFGQLLKEIKVGSSRQEALREMAYRVDLSAVNSFVAILISADQMGASIGKILRQQSEQIRAERIVRAEKAGAAAAQKIIFPLVLFIMPAVLIMIFGPFILGAIYGGGASSVF